MMTSLRPPVFATLSLLAAAGCTKADPAAPPPCRSPSPSPSRERCLSTLPRRGRSSRFRRWRCCLRWVGRSCGSPLPRGRRCERGRCSSRSIPVPSSPRLSRRRRCLSAISAQVANAEQDVSRYSALAEKEYVTSQQYDQARTTAASAGATVSGGRAAVDQAKLNVQYATIRSPISGTRGKPAGARGLSRECRRRPRRSSRSTRSIRFSCASRCRRRACSAFASTHRATLPVTAQPASGGARRARHALLRRQRHRHDDGHHPAQGHVREHGWRALAGRVRRRRRSALSAAERDRGADAGRGRRAERQFPLRQSTPDSTATPSGSRSTVPRATSRSFAGREAGRAGRDGRPAATEFGNESADQAAGRRRSAEGRMKYHETVHQTSRHDDTRHGGHSALRHRLLPQSRGERSADGRLPDGFGERLASRRESRNDGLVRRDAAREAVLDHRRLSTHDVAERVGRHEHHAAVRASTATSTRPRRTCRRRSRRRCASSRRTSCRRSYQKVDPSASADPVLRAALVVAPAVSSSTSTPKHFWRSDISMVSGVAQVQVYGSQKYAVRIQLDPQAMAHAQDRHRRGRDAVNTGNVNLPTGVLWGTDKAYTVQANGQLTNAKEFRPLIVAYRNGAPVRLRGHRQRRRRRAGQQAGELVQRCSARSCSRCSVSPARTPSRSRQLVKDEMAQMEASSPASVTVADALRQVGQRSSSRCTDVKFTLMLTLFLVVLVIFIFLRNIRATVIPSLALPMSLVGTFAVMYMLDYSLDNLSLMALTLSVGFVVDDAIVMLENIVRHIEKGEPVIRVGARGIARDRLHDSLDDALARRRVHSRALSRRTGRPALPRVRRDHRRWRSSSRASSRSR